MASLIPSSANRSSNNDSEICCICRDPFQPGEERWTHEGGEGHDGFHRPCLKKWVQQSSSPSPFCPLDRTPIDPTPIFSWTERVILPAFKLAAVTACCSTMLVTPLLLERVKVDPTRVGTGTNLALGACTLGVWYFQDQIRASVQNLVTRISRADSLYLLAGVVTTNALSRLWLDTTRAPSFYTALTTNLTNSLAGGFFAGLLKIVCR